MATQLVRILETYTAADGTPLTGTVEFDLIADLPVFGDRTYPAGTTTATVDNTGLLRDQAATGDLTLVPSDPPGSPYAAPGVPYRITQRLAGERPRVWTTYLAANAPPVDGVPTIYLHDLIAAQQPSILVDAASTGGLNAETAARIAADDILTADLATETARAEQAEQTLAAELAAVQPSALANALNAETARAEQAENTLTANLAAEIARAEQAETTLTAAETNVAAGLAAETARAEQAEQTNAAGLAAHTAPGHPAHPAADITVDPNLAGLASTNVQAALAELAAHAAADDTAETLASGPYVADVDGVPTFVDAFVMDLLTGEQDTTTAVAIPEPGDNNDIVVTDTGDLLLVARAETPLATVDALNHSTAAALAAAETYTDLEVGLHAAAADPHPQYALDTDVAALPTFDDLLAYSLILGGI